MSVISVFVIHGERLNLITSCKIFKMVFFSGFGFACRWDPFISLLRESDYTGVTLASGIQDLLNGFAVTLYFEVVYHPARGTISIQANSEGMDSHNQFYTHSGFGIMTWGVVIPMRITHGNGQGLVQTVETHSLQSINGVLRSTEMIHLSSEPEYYRLYGSGFIDLLNVHNVDLHCPNLGHFNSICVRGENTIIKTIPVSSGCGYLKVDYVVAPHDKIDVSRQFIKNNSI